MKKLFVVSVIAFALVFTLSAASVYAQGLTRAGLRAGLNLADAWGDDVDEFTYGTEKKMRTGAAFGGFIEYSVNDNFAIQPEFQYTMKGLKLEGVGIVYWYDPIDDVIYYDYADMVGTIKLSYLEIPVLAKISIPTQGNVRPVLLLGPALAIKLSAKAELDVAEPYSEAGGTFDVRYTLGLVDVPDIEGMDLAVKNAVISFMLGYCFPL
jgi:hypothetical protein